VLFCIEPWNFPYYQLARVAGPNLMFGNTLIVKHAPNVPQARRHLRCCSSIPALQRAFIDVPPVGAYKIFEGQWRCEGSLLKSRSLCCPARLSFRRRKSPKVIEKGTSIGS
jgi:hypothetical protein